MHQVSDFKDLSWVIWQEAFMLIVNVTGFKRRDYERWTFNEMADGRLENTWLRSDGYAARFLNISCLIFTTVHN